MAISVFDLFSIGIGPSSSHTVGPMRAAGRFLEKLDGPILDELGRLQASLYGSLAATGKGHGSDKAVMLGLMGESPETVDTDTADERVRQVRDRRVLVLPGGRELAFDPAEDVLFHRRENLPDHPNGLVFSAYDRQGDERIRATYYSIGGGFLSEPDGEGRQRIVADQTEQPFPFTTAEQLLAHCNAQGLSISEIMLRNEQVWRDKTEIGAGLQRLWSVMRACIQKGCETEGVLPGGLKVKRRAPRLYRQLQSERHLNQAPLGTMDWVNLYAMAVNEENAAGGRIVTAPTNGAAGIIPAIVQYYLRFCSGTEEGVERFLLTAGAIAILYKENASISGAEVGCQGEVGSACSMAAGALTEVLGGTPSQVGNAAEIAMEHNLGLTCDPVGGLVQVPCIERNAMGAVKAINASRMALRGDGKHYVSLDKVIKTMRDTGADMQTKYKETSQGGLAVNVVEC